MFGMMLSDRMMSVHGIFRHDYKTIRYSKSLLILLDIPLLKHFRLLTILWISGVVIDYRMLLESLEDILFFGILLSLYNERVHDFLPDIWSLQVSVKEKHRSPLTVF